MLSGKAAKRLSGNQLEHCHCYLTKRTYTEEIKTKCGCGNFSTAHALAGKRTATKC